MIKKTIIGVVAVVAIMIATVAVTNNMKTESTKKVDVAGNAAEQQFMEQMTSHHMDAIQMADMAMSRAKNKQVQSLVGGITTAQTNEVSQMKTWYKQWFSKDMPEMAAMPVMMADGMDMGKLNSAKDFDLEFVNQMIPHHQSAVQMAKDILPKAKHAEIKKLANDIISSQNMEIQEMQQLQTEFKANPVGTTTRHAIDCGDDSPGC